MLGFATAFTDVTKRRAVPEEASIYTDEMTAIKIALKKIYKGEKKDSYYYRLSELYAVHRIQL